MIHWLTINNHPSNPQQPIHSLLSTSKSLSFVNRWLLWFGYKPAGIINPTPGTSFAEKAKLPRKRLAVNLWKCRGHIGRVRVNKATLANHPRVCAGDASCQLAILIHICVEFGHAETIIQTSGGKLAVCVRRTSQGTFSVPNFWFVLPSWTGLAKKWRRSEVVSLQANAVWNRGALWKCRWMRWASYSIWSTRTVETNWTCWTVAKIVSVETSLTGSELQHGHNHNAAWWVNDIFDCRMHDTQLQLRVDWQNHYLKPLVTGAFDSCLRFTTFRQGTSQSHCWREVAPRLNVVVRSGHFPQIASPTISCSKIWWRGREGMPHWMRNPKSPIHVEYFAHVQQS